jgi:hypothetical protein
MGRLCGVYVQPVASSYAAGAARRRLCRGVSIKCLRNDYRLARGCAVSTPVNTYRVSIRRSFHVLSRRSRSEIHLAHVVSEASIRESRAISLATSAFVAFCSAPFSVKISCPFGSSWPS